MDKIGLSIFTSLKGMAQPGNTMRILSQCLIAAFFAFSTNAFADDTAIDAAISKLDADLNKMQADINAGADKDTVHADRARIKADQAVLNAARKAARIKLLSGK